MKKSIKSILGLFTLALLAVFLLYSNHTSAEESQKIEQYAIPTEALPDGVRILSQEMAEKTDLFHPLNTASAPSETSPIADSQERAKLFDYGDVYASSMLIEGVMVGNFVYQYDSPKMAEEAATLLKRDLQAAMPLVAETETTFTLEGDEGDSIRWYIAPQEEMLILVVANGLEAKTVAETFNTVLTLIDNK